ncbi:MAG: phytoene synthase, partial [Paracoccaceae bacterium]
LARQGLARLAEARKACRTLPKAAAPALLAGWQAEPLLRIAARDPAAVPEGRLLLSEFSRRGRLMWQAFSSRW